jgi:hypothetical protein
MKLRQLFENIYEEQSITDVAIIFGRFNPPHQGHKAAWEAASSIGEWYVGTNQSTEGPKDPLPFNIKIEAMKAIWPDVADHLLAEQSWWTLASQVYKKHGPVTLHIVTDATDAKIFVPGLQKSNGVEGPHGFYRFKDIVWEEAPRISSATDLRKAVAEDNPQKFEEAAGVPANTPVAGKPFFEVVKHYLTPYLHQAAEKERLKSEKEAAKAAKKQEPEVAEEFGVGKITAQNTTADVNASTPGKNLRAFKLAEEIARLEYELQEATEKKMSKRQQQATRGVNTFGDAERWNGDYTMYRFGMAAACSNGKDPIDMPAKSWIGKSKAAFPYTPEEQDMLKQAYKAAGADFKDLNHGDMESQELETTNKTSPVAKSKKNKYGV